MAITETKAKLLIFACPQLLRILFVHTSHCRNTATISNPSDATLLCPYFARPAELVHRKEPIGPGFDKQKAGPKIAFSKPTERRHIIQFLLLSLLHFFFFFSTFSL